MSFDPKQEAAFSEALGRALSHWQFVETGLYLITHCILGAKPILSSIVFFQIRSPEKKLALADRLLAVTLDRTVYDTNWKPLRKLILDQVDLRNAIAHFEATWLLHDETISHLTEFPIALTPHHLDVTAVKGGAVRSLFVEQLRELADDYSETARKLFRFAHAHVPDTERHAALLPQDLQRALEILSRTNSEK